MTSTEALEDIARPLTAEELVGTTGAASRIEAMVERRSGRSYAARRRS